jgi:hypothetical protein
MKRHAACAALKRGELAVTASVSVILPGDLFERFRQDCRGVSIKIDESTCSASCASGR